MNLLPAVLVGGPPHAGKSVLSCSLAQALRSRKCAHYLMRAAPDGEGDWACEADQRVVQDIRFKGEWTQRWIDVVCRDLANRPLPLLVDVGGRPTAAQQAIFDQCTHAILLTRDGAERAQWLAYAQAHSLRVIADLRSDLSGVDALERADPAIAGVLAGLGRGEWAKGPAFDALVDRLADLFHSEPGALYQAHLAIAPFAAQPNTTYVNVVNLEDIAQRLRGDHRFQRADIPAVLARIPSAGPLALYGRAPIWLYVAIALQRDVTWQFDIRLGWVRPPRLVMAAPGATAADDAPVHFSLRDGSPGDVTLAVTIGAYYLDYEAAGQVTPPFIPAAARVWLDGRLPLWLATALAATYRGCAGVDVLQPQERAQR